MRVEVERYVAEADDRILVFGRSKVDGEKVSFHVVGPRSRRLREMIDAGAKVEVDLESRKDRN